MFQFVANKYLGEKGQGGDGWLRRKKKRTSMEGK